MRLQLFEKITKQLPTNHTQPPFIIMLKSYVIISILALTSTTRAEEAGLRSSLDDLDESEWSGDELSNENAVKCDWLKPPFDLQCPEEGLTKLNGIVMEDVAPMTRYIEALPIMLNYTDHNGLLVTTYQGIREPQSRMAIHMHPFGGQTCVISGPPATVFLEGVPGSTEYPAGTCYYMPPGKFMVSSNLGDEDQNTIDILAGKASTVVCEPGWADVCRGRGCRFN